MVNLDKKIVFYTFSFLNLIQIWIEFWFWPHLNSFRWHWEHSIKINCLFSVVLIQISEYISKYNSSHIYKCKSLITNSISCSFSCFQKSVNLVGKSQPCNMPILALASSLFCNRGFPPSFPCGFLGTCIWWSILE